MRNYWSTALYPVFFEVGESFHWITVIQARRTGVKPTAEIELSKTSDSRFNEAYKFFIENLLKII